MADEESAGGTSGDAPVALATARLTALAALDERIAKTQDPRELVLLTQIRAEILRHDEELSDRREARYLQRVRVWASYGFSMLSIGLGSGLLALQHDAAGYFVIGAGIFVFVPRYVMTVLRGPAGGHHDEA